LSIFCAGSFRFRQQRTKSGAGQAEEHRDLKEQQSAVGNQQSAEATTKRKTGSRHSALS